MVYRRSRILRENRKIQRYGFALIYCKNFKTTGFSFMPSSGAKGYNLALTLIFRVTKDFEDK